jgi:uncharacterized membrane protein
MILSDSETSKMLDQLIHPLQVEEMRLLLRLRENRRKHRTAKPGDCLTLGARVSDKVAATVGSWRFIIIQSVILVIWMFLNVTAYVEQWDPYPFILLNLVLSFQAAYTAPVIMMSQNRQGTIDRESAQHDYDINIKSELEIELLHQKLDMLREKEFAELIGIIRSLETQLAATNGALLALGNK